MRTTTKCRQTKQREIVLNVIKSACYHPTAEQIFRLTKKKLPKISVGTVYRNLDVLLSHQMIKRIDIPGEPARFDGDMTDKAYFVCQDKKAIYDLKIDADKLSSLVKNNELINKISNFNLLILGISNDSATERGLRKGTLIRLIK